ncbi:MAG: hypothetical protein GX638_15435 [Crenarchaeota archaeon]|nr:hypothetical protein [Thermoproteota archaeon]
MSKFITDDFKITKNGTYRIFFMQIGALISGLILLAFFIPLFIPLTYDSYIELDYSGIIFLTIFDILMIGLGLHIVSLGLLTLTTEIDIKRRIVQLTKRNMYGRSAKVKTSLDNVQISALRMGVTDANPADVWIVRAGIYLENKENESCISELLWSRELSKVDERNQLMFELFSFFNPDIKPVPENNFITNGDVVFLFTDAQMKEFPNWYPFQKKSDEQIAIDSKFDKLLE